jgi:light-independent protochlorophyllide reductase subunit B
VHPLMMGLEEHLLGMFREDFEFHDEAAPSHLGKAAQKKSVEPPASEPERVPEMALADAGTKTQSAAAPQAAAAQPVAIQTNGWTADAEKELAKIPFFVRGKARRNTERFASERGIVSITIETLYDAKAHYSR